MHRCHAIDIYEKDGEHWGDIYLRLKGFSPSWAYRASIGPRVSPEHIVEDAMVRINGLFEFDADAIMRELVSAGIVDAEKAGNS